MGPSADHYKHNHNDYNPTATMHPNPKLFSTTNPEQILQTLVHNYDTWGKPFHSLDQYIEREKLLRQTPFSKSRLETWILVDPKAPMSVLSACETYEYPCLSVAEGELVQGTCFAIASVFTPNAHRRRGYAAKMLSLLLQELKSRKGAVASTLYSDIGPNYYSKIGWEAHPSVSLVLDLNPSIPPVTLLSPDCKLLDLASTKPLLESDAQAIKAEFKAKVKSSKDPLFCILPCFQSQEWLYVRANFYAKLKNTTVSNSGASVVGTTDYITWTHDINVDTLLITHIRSSSQHSAVILLQCALMEAQSWSFKKIELWDPSDDLAKWSKLVHPSFCVQHRTDSLSSLVFWGKDLKGRRPSWVCNETFAWV